MLRVTLNLPPIAAADVAKRDLSVAVNGAEPTVSNPALTDTTFAFECESDATCAAKIRDTDKSGNVGEWSATFDFVAADTFAPGAPGALGLASIEQI